MDIKKILGGVSPYSRTQVDKGDSASSSSRVERAKARVRSTSAEGDKVSVSSDALLVAEAAKAAEESPDVRVDRVEALRQQVQTGTYTPDSRKIAEKLVQSDLEFLRG